MAVFNKKFLCIVGFLPLLACEAGTVRLFNGETHSGKLAMASNGLAVTEGQSIATYDLDQILFASFGDTAPSGAGSFPAGALLTNGSFVAGPVLAFADPTVKCGTQEHPVSIPRDSIAAVAFANTHHATMDQLPVGKTGAVLPNGDFFEAVFNGIKDNAAMFNSPIFGPHSLVIKTQISAVVLRSVQPGTARYEIDAKDGSRYLSSDIKIQSDGVLVNDSILGPVQVGNADLVSFSASSGRYKFLTDLKPLATTGATSGTNATPTVSTTSEGQNEKMLTTRANVAVSYAIPSGLTAFSCGLALPKEAPPASLVTFAVYCDGRLVARSNQIGAATAPQSIQVNLGTGQKLTLRVEPATPGSDGVVGEWIEPILVHP